MKNKEYYKKWLKLLEGRLLSYRSRKTLKIVIPKRINAFFPYFNNMTIRKSKNMVCHMMLELVPQNAQLGQDEPGTESCDKKFMELDHVIPITWLYHHRSYFLKDPERIGLILGWFNILQTPHNMNRQKSCYTPDKDDIDMNINNKKIYFMKKNRQEME